MFASMTGRIFFGSANRGQDPRGTRYSFVAPHATRGASSMRAWIDVEVPRVIDIGRTRNARPRGKPRNFGRLSGGVKTLTGVRDLTSVAGGAEKAKKERP